MGLISLIEEANVLILFIRFCFYFVIIIGKYIYIEASRRKKGDTALLESEMFDRRVCLQFWYHMNGKDIGDLRMYARTNTSSDLLWSVSGNQGTDWLFGQVAAGSVDPFQV